ncbi:unnamed protein product [Vitrella brassicaformis CCMP3155]|uniref:Uncharacterized protein n=1 Tax=Vitrella brassicaformis (strain CCMP3155) TaxID=1169540 RepID=A0A0G4H0P3_VITBC|nr:unnamed protein product [Vitrella brassicaformis CCMP3155]|eukprot:CEM37123.1 unnamed protein product [Vitrella brassicaformis CCMP3155]
MERTYAASARCAEAFELLGGYCSLMAVMPFGQAAKYIITVVEAHLDKFPMRSLNPDGAVQVGRLRQTPSTL